MTPTLIFPGGPRLEHSCCLEVGSVCMQDTGYEWGVGKRVSRFESKMPPLTYDLNACFPADGIFLCGCGTFGR